MTTAFTHENIVKLAGVLGTAPELRLTANGNAVATLIVYTNYTLRNDDGSRRQESDRHRVIVWGLHAEKAARLLRKGSKVRVQGRMTYPTWTDKQSGATRYGAEIVAQTLDYQGANDEDDAQIAQPAAEAPAPQLAEPVATATEPAGGLPNRSPTTSAALRAGRDQASPGQQINPGAHPSTAARRRLPRGVGKSATREAGIGDRPPLSRIGQIPQNKRRLPFDQIADNLAIHPIGAPFA